MIEMLKNRKEALQERGVKGFTLMEMLIVIAIIAVLVAIAIPVLGAQLDRSKDAADEANARSAYALMQADAMSPAKAGETPEANFSGGKLTVTLSDDTTQTFEFSDRTTGVTASVGANGEVTLKLDSKGGEKNFGTTASASSASSEG